MRVLIILFVVLNVLIAQNRIISDIPTPQNIFINISEDECDKECLEELLNSEKIFSFLSLYKNHSQRDFIQFQYEEYMKLFSKNSSQDIVKIAILVPQKSIKRYAVSTVNAVISYLIYKGYDFDSKVYNSNDDQEKSIADAIYKIHTRMDIPMYNAL